MSGKFTFSRTVSNQERSTDFSTLREYLSMAVGTRSAVSIDGALKPSESKDAHDFFLVGVVELVRSSSQKNDQDSFALVFTTGMTLTLTAGRDTIAVQTDGRSQGSTGRIIIGDFSISV